MTGTRKTLAVGLALAWVVCQQAVAEELPASNLLGRFRLLVEKANRQGPDDVMKAAPHQSESVDGRPEYRPRQVGELYRPEKGRQKERLGRVLRGISQDCGTGP